MLDTVAQGKYDPSWLFTYTDDFENISEDYAKFNGNAIPSGLKVFLVTEFGRSLEERRDSRGVYMINFNHPLAVGEAL